MPSNSSVSKLLSEFSPGSTVPESNPTSPSTALPALANAAELAKDASQRQTTSADDSVVPPQAVQAQVASGDDETEGVPSDASASAATPAQVAVPSNAGEAPDWFTSGRQLGSSIAAQQRAGFESARNARATWGEEVSDVPLGVAQGTRAFYNSITDLASRLDGGPGNSDHQPDSLTKTFAGQFTSDTTQFLIGVAGSELAVGGALKAVAGSGTTLPLLRGIVRGAKWVEGGTKAAATAKFALAAAPAQFIGFEGHEERLSNWLSTLPLGGAESVFKFLAADPSDTWLESRMKGTLEATGIGVAVDGVVGYLKSFRKATALAKAGEGDAASKLLEQASVQASEDGKLAELVQKFGDATNGKISADQLTAIKQVWAGAAKAAGMTPEAYLAKYNILVQSGEQEASLAAYRQAVADLPDVPPIAGDSNLVPHNEVHPTQTDMPVGSGEAPLPKVSDAPAAHLEPASIAPADSAEPVSGPAAPSDNLKLGDASARVQITHESLAAQRDDLWNLVRGDAGLVSRVQSALLAAETRSAAASTIADRVPSSLVGQGKAHDVVDAVMAGTKIPDPIAQPTEFSSWKRRMRAGVNPSTLYQDGVDAVASAANRGRTDFLSDTSALITLFRTADFSTILHESFHVFRRFGLAPELEDKLAASYGLAKDAAGRWAWTVEAEETAARNFENFLASGKAPSPEQAEMFGKMRTWMQAVYQGVTDSPLSAEVNPDVRNVFEKMVGSDGKTVPPSVRPAASDSLPTFAASASNAGKDLALIGGAGKGITESMYDALWDKVQKGVTDEAGAPSATLQVAKVLRDAGQLKTLDAFKAAAQAAQAVRDSGVTGAEYQQGLKDVVQRFTTGSNTLFQAAKFAIPEQAATDFQDALSKAKSFSDASDAVADVAKSFVNYNRMALTTDAQGVLEEAMKFVEDAFSKRGQFGETLSLKDAQAQAAGLADDLGTGAKPFLRALKDAKNIEGQAIRLVAYRHILAAQGEEIAGLAKAIKNGLAGDDGLARLTAAIKPFLGLRYSTKIIETEGARIPSFGRITADSTLPDTVDKVSNAIETSLRLGGPDSDHLLVQLAAASSDVSRLGSFMKTFETAVQGKLRIAGSMAMEFWMNGLISAFRTMSTNVLTQTLESLYRPAETIAGGAIRGLFGASDGSGWEMVRQGSQIYVGLGESSLDILRLLKIADDVGRPNTVAQGWKTFTTETPLLTKLTSVDRDYRAITAANASALFGVNPAGNIARAIGYLGKAVRLPSNILAGTDEVVKGVNYQAYIRAKALEVAYASGVDKQGPSALADFVNNAIRNATDSNGAGLFPDGVKYAEASTFTTKLDPNSLGAGLTNITANVPPLKLVFPFIRTPSNILNRTWQRTPLLQVLSSELRHQLFNGSPEEKAEATGRIALSAASLLGFVYLAQSGRFTGSGPVDPRERDALLATGWQPFSVVINNEDGTKTYASYSRLDPHAPLIAAAADYAYYHGDLPESEKQDIAKAFILSTARQLTSKTFLTGLSMWASALSGDESAASKLIKNYAGSVVPNVIPQNVLPLSNAEGWEHLQEAGSYADAIYRRLPGYGDHPRRNILGEPMLRNSGYADFDAGDSVINSLSPVAFSKSVSDPVKTEMAELGSKFTRPPKAYRSFDLTQFKNAQGQDAYDRMLQLRGEVKVGGKTLSESLNRLVTSDFYRSIAKDAVDRDGNSVRADRLQHVISIYHQASLREMLKEYPQINAAVAEKATRIGQFTPIPAVFPGSFPTPPVSPDAASK